MTKKYVAMRKDRVTRGYSFYINDTYQDATDDLGIRQPQHWEVVELDIKTAEKPYVEPELHLGDLVVAEDGLEHWGGSGWLTVEGSGPFMRVFQERFVEWRSRDGLPERIKVVKRRV